MQNCMRTLHIYSITSFTFIACLLQPYPLELQNLQTSHYLFCISIIFIFPNNPEQSSNLISMLFAYFPVLSHPLQVLFGSHSWPFSLAPLYNNSVQSHAMDSSTVHPFFDNLFTLYPLSSFNLDHLILGFPPNITVLNILCYSNISLNLVANRFRYFQQCNIIAQNDLEERGWRKLTYFCWRNMLLYLNVLLLHSSGFIKTLTISHSSFFLLPVILLSIIFNW